MTFIQKAMCSLGLALLPASVLAAPPNITHIEARLENGTLSVVWDPVEDEIGIDFYRVYFSHESILDHEGNYDDSVRTDGDQTAFDFGELPLQSEKIYVAILAVNKDGTESEGFESEASIEVPPTTDIPEDQPDTENPMMMDEVRSDSETELHLLFNKQVATTVQFTPEFFVLTDLDGVVLGVDSVEVRDATIVLHTTPQDSGKEYLLSIMQPIPAEDGTNLSLTDVPMRWMAFEHQDDPPADEEQPPEEEPPQEDIPYDENPSPEEEGPPEDPVDLALRAMRRSDGTYNVVAEWGRSEDSRGTLHSYVLYTSRDGDTFDRSTMVAIDQTSIQYTAIPAGVFGVRVASNDALGHESGGIQEVITLPESGIGLLGITVVSGLFAARRTRRRKSC